MSLNFIYQPSTVERGANFKKPPIIIKFENFPAGYSYFTAIICLKDENNERYVNESLGGHTIASPIFDEVNNAWYFKIRYTNIKERGKFRVEVQVYGIHENPELPQDYLTHDCTDPIKVSSRDPNVRLNSEEEAFLNYIKSLKR